MIKRRKPAEQYVKQIMTESDAKELLDEISSGCPRALEEDFANTAFSALSWVSRFRSRCLPADYYGWGDQLVRSLGSVVANAVEGRARGTRRNNIQFLRVARGSAYEAVVWSRVSGQPELIELCQKCAEEFDAYARSELSPLVTTGMQ